VLLSR